MAELLGPDRRFTPKHQNQIFINNFSINFNITVNNNQDFESIQQKVKDTLLGLNKHSTPKKLTLSKRMQPVVIKQEAELQQACVFVDGSAPLWQRQMALNGLKSEPS